MQIDTEKFPLGQLSKVQVAKGHAVLEVMTSGRRVKLGANPCSVMLHAAILERCSPVAPLAADRAPDPNAGAQRCVGQKRKLRDTGRPDIRVLHGGFMPWLVGAYCAHGADAQAELFLVR